LNNKTIRNLKDARGFYKKRVLRIYPLYLFFVLAFVIIDKPPLSEIPIYIVGLQALFYPIYVSTFAQYHFLSAIIIFYLLFPVIVFFDDYKKMLIVSLITLLFFATIYQFNVSDYLLLGYFAVFVAGIVAAKANLYNKIRRMKVDKRTLVLSIFLVGAFLTLLLWGRAHVNSAVLGDFLNSLSGIPVTVIMLYWAVVYVKIFNTKFRAFFSFLAFSTFGVVFIFEPFFRALGNAIFVRFNITGVPAFTVLVAFIPLVVVTGYLLQLITNVLVNAAVFHFHRLRADND
jgi:peptidoglycan/LPS O-acetylase OafA/YrhL